MSDGSEYKMYVNRRHAPFAINYYLGGGINRQNVPLFFGSLPGAMDVWTLGLLHF